MDMGGKLGGPILVEEDFLSMDFANLWDYLQAQTSMIVDFCDVGFPGVDIVDLVFKG